MLNFALSACHSYWPSPDVFVPMTEKMLLHAPKQVEKGPIQYIADMFIINHHSVQDQGHPRFSIGNRNQKRNTNYGAFFSRFIFYPSCVRPHIDTNSRRHAGVKRRSSQVCTPMIRSVGPVFIYLRYSDSIRYSFTTLFRRRGFAELRVQ